MQKGRKECRRRLIAGGLASMLAVTTVFNGGVSARGQAAAGQAGAPAFQFADNGGGRYTDAYQDIVFTRDGGYAVMGYTRGWSASAQGYLTSTEDGGQTCTDLIPLWQSNSGKDASLPRKWKSGGADDVIIKVNAESGVDFCTLHNYAKEHNTYTKSSPAEKMDALTLDADGAVIITAQNEVAKDINNAVIAKFSGTDGKLLWDRMAGSSSYQTPDDGADKITTSYRAVAVLTDGSYVVTGSSTNDAATEEGWTCTSARDTIVVHYQSDGTFIHAESFGRAGDSASRPEGIAAAPDGGYYVCGSQSGILYEDELLQKGYDFGNYGAQDAILIKYDTDDKVVWAENYGSTNGDWFNSVAVGDDGRLVVVGESNGKYGYPSYGNNGGLDGIVLVSDGTSTGSAASGLVYDKDVVWADGTYTASGTGYAENGVTVTVTIENHKIAGIESVNNKETDGYYRLASALTRTIEARQTADVDVVSGATMSSNAVKEAARRALSQAAARTVDDLILAIAAADEAAKKPATQTAAEAYAQLGSYALASLEQTPVLKTACETYGIRLVENSSGAALAETEPRPASADLKYNDTYYKLQREYYKNIEAEAFAAAGLTGEGVKIAVLDSGITGSHADLDYERILAGYDYDNGKDYNVEGGEPLIDNNGHGTAVTGILAAQAGNGIGVAGLLSRVQIVPLRITPFHNEKTAANIKKSQESSKLAAQAILDAVDNLLSAAGECLEENPCV